MDLGIIAGSRLRLQPNVFIGNMGDIYTDETALANHIQQPVSNIQFFNIDANNNVSFYVPYFNVFDNMYKKGPYNQITYLESYVGGSFSELSPFRSVNSLQRLIMPKITSNNIVSSNSYAIQSQNITEIDLRNLSGLWNNMIRFCPNLISLNTDNITKVGMRSLRGLPLVTKINLRKAKWFGDDNITPLPIFDQGMNNNLTLNLNSYLLTSNSGNLNAKVADLNSRHPNWTFNFYDDNNNFIQTL